MSCSKPGQISLFGELLVDNFAGGGGASVGAELALGRPVDIAINHDPAAILMHKTNHPYTRHYQESVWDIDPVEVCGGQKVGLAWFSPDCKHFSKAKGAALVEKKIRGLAWVVLRWAGTVRPRVIILENVEEFKTWGPVRKGKPVKSKAGQTFRKWLSQLEALGYAVEHRELVAADYGAPTSRKRFFLVARCDGRPIVWPERTHAPAGSEDVRSGRYKPWRSAAEIIDWSIPCPSIFDSRADIKAKYGVNAIRPLAENTQRRVALGLDKFVLKSSRPFIINCKFANAPESIARPMSTATAVGSHLLCAPAISQYHAYQTDHARGQSIDRPVLTVDTSNRYALIGASLVEYYGQGTGQAVNIPLHTVTTRDREGLSAVHLHKYFDGGYTGAGADVSSPLPTVTAVDHNAVCAANLIALRNNMGGQPAEAPVSTITASGKHIGLVKTYLVKAAEGLDLQRWPEIRAMLNRYCGYQMAEDEVLLLELDGTLWYISDIGLRMLTPKELYRAQGFPEDYIIDRDYMGNRYKKSAQVARCGNAVPPPFAKALVTANLPEYAVQGIGSMAELEEAIAV